jgi:hypothetical protein
MLSDVTTAPVASRGVADADDFEWVNAWAASAPSPARPASRESIPQGTALVQELAHITPKEQPAPPPVSDVAQGPASEAPALEVLTNQVVAPPVASEAGVEQPGAAMPTPPAPPPQPDASEAPVMERGRDQEIAEPAAAEPDAPLTAVASPDVSPLEASPELVDEQAASDEKPGAPIAFLDLARRAKAWRSLFGMARRDEPKPEAADPLEALPESSDALAADAVMPVELVPAIAPDQLEQDIAEIAARRDALLAEYQPVPRVTVLERPRRSRTTDYVPILLGCVLGFTLVVVFGAAASFVSLR